MAAKRLGSDGPRLLLLLSQRPIPSGVRALPGGERVAFTQSEHHQR